MYKLHLSLYIYAKILKLLKNKINTSQSQVSNGDVILSSQGYDFLTSLKLMCFKQLMCELVMGVEFTKINISMSK